MRAFSSLPVKDRAIVRGNPIAIYPLSWLAQILQLSVGKRSQPIRQSYLYSTLPLWILCQRFRKAHAMVSCSQSSFTKSVSETSLITIASNNANGKPSLPTISPTELRSNFFSRLTPLIVAADIIDFQTIATADGVGNHARPRTSKAHDCFHVLLNSCAEKGASCSMAVLSLYFPRRKVNIQC